MEKREVPPRDFRQMHYAAELISFVLILVKTLLPTVRAMAE